MICNFALKCRENESWDLVKNDKEIIAHWGLIPRKQLRVLSS